MTLLSEFPQQVIASHALIVAEVMSGERPSADVLLELAAELLVVDKLTVMAARQVRMIRDARDCWAAGYACYRSSADLWNQIPGDDDDRLTGHGRLLTRLIRSADERREFYSVTDRDRAVYNAQRDHGLPCALPE
jgi:hypothetical protein